MLISTYYELFIESYLQKRYGVNSTIRVGVDEALKGNWIFDYKVHRKIANLKQFWPEWIFWKMNYATDSVMLLGMVLSTYCVYVGQPVS